MLLQVGCWFQDVHDMLDPIECFLRPLEVDEDNIPVHVLNEMDLLRQEPPDTGSIRGGAEFFRALDADKFPRLRKFARRMPVMFGTTYPCEQFFSRMGLVKSKISTKISHSHLKRRAGAVGRASVGMSATRARRRPHRPTFAPPLRGPRPVACLLLLGAH